MIVDFQSSGTNVLGFGAERVCVSRVSGFRIRVSQESGIVELHVGSHIQVRITGDLRFRNWGSRARQQRPVLRV